MKSSKYWLIYLMNRLIEYILTRVLLLLKNNYFKVWWSQTSPSSKCSSQANGAMIENCYRESFIALEIIFIEAYFVSTIINRITYQFAFCTKNIIYLSELKKCKNIVLFWGLNNYLYFLFSPISKKIMIASRKNLSCNFNLLNFFFYFFVKQ